MIFDRRRGGRWAKALAAGYVNAGRADGGAGALDVCEPVCGQGDAGEWRGVQPLFTLQEQKMEVKNFRYIDFLLPGLIAMSVMQMSVFSVAFVFTQYKEKGILKRILATPLRPVQFVTANVFTRLLVATAQAGIFIVLGGRFFTRTSRDRGGCWG